MAKNIIDIYNDFKINSYKYYDGGNGNKICLTDKNGQNYMLKTPPVNKGVKNRRTYSNGCVSEYLGCHIYEYLGFKTQETHLVPYRINGKEKLCVLCKDFEKDNKKLFKFSEIKNSIVDSSLNGYGVELDEVLQTLEEQTIFDKKALKSFFWDMFIVDAFLGNFDRHNGNWGFLLDERNQTAEIAPIYDCGSCLYPQMEKENMKKMLNDVSEIEKRIFVFPNSALKIDGKKINYFDFISSDICPDCTKAFLNIYSCINKEDINNIIYNTPYISDIEKKFYSTMLNERKEKIFDLCYEILNERQKDKDDRNKRVCMER